MVICAMLFSFDGALPVFIVPIHLALHEHWYTNAVKEWMSSHLLLLLEKSPSSRLHLYKVMHYPRLTANGATGA